MPSHGSLERRLVERFLRYTAIPSQSVFLHDQMSPNKIPSSPGQQIFAELLARELREAGLEEVVCDDQATVSALCRGGQDGKERAPRIGFICHLDTYDCGLSPEVKAQLLHYDHGDVCLNRERGIWMRLAEHPELGRYENQDILFTDGTSVLGADNKAAVSVVMELVATLKTLPKGSHGDVVVCFVPDEEIGLIGAKNLNVQECFDVDFAYTIDCTELGEVVYECFNAATVKLRFKGVSAHPMSAKGVLVNPLLMAMDYIALFDPKQTPECTELREGYWWFAGMQATTTEASLHAMIREHDLARFDARKQAMLDAVKTIEQKYPTGHVEIQIEDVYSNISNSIKGDFTAVELLLEVVQQAGVEPKVIPMRGGTDGAALSTRGILTPNFFTGAHNFHSPFEFLPIPSFVKSFEVARNIVLLGAKREMKRA
ncbi:unnamed protein product [Phytomonas sp. Hart1]|nr:unnamed protein product [Phytomonas sp. Hart1]|eukprot:CCW69691.1 unnamed protein product [Phytomonas sp. isolate Hart1]